MNSLPTSGCVRQDILGYGKIGMIATQLPSRFWGSTRRARVPTQLLFPSCLNNREQRRFSLEDATPSRIRLASISSHGDLADAGATPCIVAFAISALYSPIVRAGGVRGNRCHGADN